jgi:hypothetical protein
MATRLCAHGAAVPVDLLATGERVAWLCPDCDCQLPADWEAAATAAPGQSIYGGIVSYWTEEASRG